MAVIDTGVDYDHPDLYENIWVNQGEIPASRKDQPGQDIDGDGLITFRDLNDPQNQGSTRSPTSTATAGSTGRTCWRRCRKRRRPG